MKFIEVVGKKFKLASRFERLYAFFIDGVLLAGALLISFVFLQILKFGQYCKIMLPRQKAGVYRLEN